MGAVTNFCCRSGGSNLNAGTRLGDTTEPGTSANFTYAAGTWVQSTRVFTVASGNPSSDGVAVGDWGSVYVTAGATITTFISKVTARDATTITFANMGTSPANGSGTMTCKIGGAWAGPSGTEGFPLEDLITFGTGNSGSQACAINLKNDQTYNITAQITRGDSQIVIARGYTSTYGDKGKAEIDGGTSGAAYTLMNGVWVLEDLIFDNNGATGSGGGFSSGTGPTMALRCVFRNMRGVGFRCGGVGFAYECEAYNNLLSGFQVPQCINCVSHDNTEHGFYLADICVNCIADSNILNGFHGVACLVNCDAVLNGVEGSAGPDSPYFQLAVNCNFIKNADYGVSASGALFSTIMCGYGAGTAANTAGTFNTYNSLVDDSSFVYATNAVPWSGYASGNFNIDLAASQQVGYQELESTGGYTGVGYPDIGAIQSFVSAAMATIGLGYQTLVTHINRFIGY